MAQQIGVVSRDQGLIHIPLDELESLVGPTLLCLPGRPAVMVPIQAQYSELLLGHGAQLSLLAQFRTSLYQQRHYISDARTINRFAPGALLLFYESGVKGQRAAIAIARIVRSYVKAQGDIQITPSWSPR